MPSFGVIGAGHVGWVLSRALVQAGWDCVGVADLDATAATKLATRRSAPVLSPTEVLLAAHLTLLTVPDQAIAAAAHQAAATIGAVSNGKPSGTISGTNAPAERTPAGAGTPATSPTTSPVVTLSVVHCSGALGLEPLMPLHAVGWAIGSWHPLQAFPSTTTMLAPDITWAITAQAPLAGLLAELSRRLDGHPLVLTEDTKTLYHAAAVLAANYSVTLAAHAAELLSSCGMTRPEALAALIPLLRSTIDGLAVAGLPDALTGPLVRGDLATVSAHLDALAAFPKTSALYRSAATATLPLLSERGCDPAVVHRASLLINDIATD